MSKHGGAQRWARVAPKSTLQKTLLLLMATALLLPNMAATRAIAAAAGNATLSVGSLTEYGNAGTYKYRVTGGGVTNGFAYCVDPNLGSPAPGQYSYYTGKDVANMMEKPGRYEELRIQAWYSYGAPGFTKEVYPSTWWDGSPMTDENYHAVSHILLSDTFSSQGHIAWHGDEAHADWYRDNIIGMKWVGDDLKFNYEATGRKVLFAKYADKVPPPGVFDVMVLDGSPNQHILFWRYNPKGDAALKKTSSAPDYTSDNPNYALDGATYDVFASSDLTDKVGTLTTNSDGNTNTLKLNAGTYYVKETKASKGFQLDPTVRTVAVKSGQTASISSVEPIGTDPLALKVKKVVPGNALGDIPDLSGLRFKVSWSKTKGAPVQLSAVFATDAKGLLDFTKATPVEGTWEMKSASGENVFPFGHVKVEELDPMPAGYASVSGNFEFDITGSGQYANWEGSKTFDAESQVLTNQPVVGGVSVTKTDNETHQGTPQGDGTLEGVTYEIVNKSVNPVYVEGKTYGVDEVVKTITTKSADGKTVATSGQVLPYGTYLIRETATPESYHNAKWERTFSIREDGQVVSFDADGERNENQVLRGGLEVIKQDQRHCEPAGDGPKPCATGNIGAGHLDGTQFTITNVSAHPVMVGGKLYQPNEDVMTITAKANSDGTFSAATGDRDLPYGTYEIRETAVGDGYRFTSEAKAWRTTVQVRAEKTIVTADKAALNAEKREDMHFTKKIDGPGERLAGVAFKVTSVTTGETHIIVTDANGGFDSSDQMRPIDRNTNENDPGLPWSTGAVEKQGDKYVVVDASKLSAKGGTYFTGFADAVLTESDGKIGYEKAGRFHPIRKTGADETHYINAFPYDTYVFEELPTPGVNDGLKLVKFTFNARDWDARGDDNPGINYDYGTVDDQVAPEVDLTSEISHIGDLKIVGNMGTYTIDDVFTLVGQDKGHDYKLTATLHAFDADGKDLGVIATAETSFKSKALYQRVKVSYPDVDMTKVPQGGKVVSYGVLTEGDKVVAKHEDPSDADQTLTVPKIGTTALGAVESEGSSVNPDITITDKVAYSGLTVGEPVTVSGKLMDKASGEVLKDADGKEVTASTTFTPTKSDGTVDVVFTFKAPADIAGKSVVAFETASIKGREFVTHADIDDEGQTVPFPKVGTKASDPADGDQEVPAAEKVTITDTVHATNLTVGKTYTISGTLHKQVVGTDGTISDGGALVDADGNEIVATKEFKADKQDMDVELSFTVDTRALAGTTVVAFEELSRNKVPLALHADITDKGQSITTPKVETTLSDTEGNKIGQIGLLPGTSGREVKLVDKVAYTNLVPGTEYKLDGSLHLRSVDGDKVSDGGVVKDADGKDVSATVTFTPEEANGTVDLPFTFTAPEDLDGNQVVAFVTLVKGEQVLFTHNDPANDAETFNLVKVGTQAADATTGTQQVGQTTTVTINDTVNYTGLIPGNTYTVTGTLHEQVTGADGNVSDGGVAVDKHGKPVTASVEFVAEAANGSVVVPFTFEVESGKLDGSTLVAFEDLYEGGRHFATHADITDKAQSVHGLKLATHLFDKAGSVAAPGLPIGDVDCSVAINPADCRAEGNAQGGEAADATKPTEGVDAGTQTEPTEAAGTEAGTQTEPETAEAGTQTDPADGAVVDGKPNAADTDTDTAIGHETKPDGNVRVIEWAKDGKVTLVDRVDYYNSAAKQNVHVKLELMWASGSALLDKDGKAVTVEKDVELAEGNGSFEMEATVDREWIGSLGGRIVAFETVTDANGHVIGSHRDLSDAEQSVVFDNEKLPPLMAIGTRLVEEGNEGAGELTPKQSADLAPKPEAESKPAAPVAGETDKQPGFGLGYDVAPRAAEAGSPAPTADASTQTDEASATEAAKPAAPVVANGNVKVIPYEASGTVKLIDYVDYRGGAERTVDVTLTIMREDGQPLLNADGKPVTTTVKGVKLAAGEGTIEVPIEIDRAWVGQDGGRVIAFEEVRDSASGKVVAEHKQLDSAAQSLHFASPELPPLPPAPEKPAPRADLKTLGQTYGPWIALGALAALGGGAAAMYVNRRRKDGDAA